MKTRCEAKTINGKRCTRRCENKRCWQHENEIEIKYRDRSDAFYKSPKKQYEVNNLYWKIIFFIMFLLMLNKYNKNSFNDYSYQNNIIRISGIESQELNTTYYY